MDVAPGARGRVRRAVVCALLASAALAASTASAAPQTFDTALPVAAGHFIFRQQFRYLEASGDPGPAGRKVRVAGGVSVLGHGLSSRSAVFAALPYLDKRLTATGPDGNRVERSTRGVGDLRLWARHTLYRDDAPGRTFRIAPFLGIEVPTGRDDDSDGAGRLPQPLQVGSGSWDPFFGVVATHQTLQRQFDVQVGYEINTEANGFEAGDQLRLDASLQHRLWPRELGGGVPAFVYGALELNFASRGKDRVEGVSDRNSGGHALFISPGLQYVTRRWIVEGIIQIPVLQDLNGNALEDDFGVRIGFRVNL